MPWPRLITMIGMLAVLMMIINRAKDPNTWRWLTNESDPHYATTVSSNTEDTDQSAESDGSVPLRELDKDPEEIDAAREEFQAISDRQPLLAEEMPSYWRLFRWANGQSSEQLARRSRKDAVFTEFAEVPEQARGKLVHLRLHLMRTLTHETPNSPLGIERVHEAWGWTDESYPWLYVVVFADSPPGMAIGPDIREEASFDGYFLKLMSYEAHQSPGKPLFAPLLVGRLVWHPTGGALSPSDNYFWLAIVGGGIVALAALARYVFASRAARLTTSAYPAQSNSADVESWLEQAAAHASQNDNDVSREDDKMNPDVPGDRS